MNAPASWFVSPAEEQLSAASAMQADKMVNRYRAYMHEMETEKALRDRQALRDRMDRIVAIDRDGTARSIRTGFPPARE